MPKQNVLNALKICTHIYLFNIVNVGGGGGGHVYVVYEDTNLYNDMGMT